VRGRRRVLLLAGGQRLFRAWTRGRAPCARPCAGTTCPCRRPTGMTWVRNSHRRAPHTARRATRGAGCDASGSRGAPCRQN